MPDGRFFLITGPSAVGKSTVAGALARRFACGVHLEGDVFRRSIVTGRHELRPDASPEALAQLRVRYRASAAAADAYLEDGYAVVLEDVVAGPFLREFLGLVRARPLHLVVLTAREDSLASRDAGRATTGYEQWSIAELARLFEEATPRLGLWLDSSDQTPTQTVDTVLARLDEARIDD